VDHILSARKQRELQLEEEEELAIGEMTWSTCWLMRAVCRVAWLRFSPDRLTRACLHNKSSHWRYLWVRGPPLTRTLNKIYELTWTGGARNTQPRTKRESALIIGYR
jgi:hypothetical protein